MLPEGVDARISARAWTPSPIFELLERIGSIDRDEMFDVFNMGVGYVLIVRPTFANSVARQLSRSGEQAFIIGEVVKGTGRVRLQ